MGNSNSNETEDKIIEPGLKKKSIKKRRAKRSKSLKQKNKIIKDDYDNTDEGAYPEFF